MQSRILSKRKLLLAAMAGCIFSLAFAYNLTPRISLRYNSALIIEENFPAQEPALQTEKQSIAGLPLRLKIPSIKVDSDVENVGLTPEGSMDVPKERANVAWFELGQRPGDNGAAVIAGHYGRENDKGAAFDNLHKLRKGDKVYIEDDNGDIISFVVRESKRYDQNAYASAVFDSNDDKAHLNLITCEGEWDKDTNQYPTRLVVFTDKE